MRRSIVITCEVRQLIVEKRLDVLLQEPHVKKQGLCHTFVGSGIGMKYSDEIEEHLRHIKAVFHSLREKRLIVVVDANARSSLWCLHETVDRGAKLEDLIQANGIEVVNDVGQAPTFWMARGSSFIDVTLVSASMSQFIGDWKVRCDWTTSDHNSVNIRLRVPRGRGGGGIANTRFDIRRADWKRFFENLTDLSRSRLEVLGLQSAEDVEEMADTHKIILNAACTASMPKKRQFRKSNPWWTRELTIIKKKAYRFKRARQKGRDEPLFQRNCWSTVLLCGNITKR
ncbi:retrovirus-related pol polyprotein [Lasius niger]|uniref:Retrovirus-related pol polyprotein n=1 Tax=Lasius niger TaxID=67767 RepID=A0A0J7KS04_LASNI|nr:retrovirus-related pol polyprotein [Lasius niger]